MIPIHLQPFPSLKCTLATSKTDPDLFNASKAEVGVNGMLHLALEQGHLTVKANVIQLECVPNCHRQESSPGLLLHKYPR